MADLWPVTGWTPDGDVDDAGGLESWGEDRGSWDADPWQAPGDRPEAGGPGTGVPAARGHEAGRYRAQSPSRSHDWSQDRPRGRARGSAVLEGSLAEVVAGNIRLEAARVGVSQAEIAKILGLSRSAVSLRYRGRVEWGITEVELVAWYLNLPFTDLFHRRASPSRGPFL